MTKKATLPKNLKYTAATTKLPVQLVPPAAIASMARGLAEGADKYVAFNYRTARAVSALTYLGAIMRHTLAYLDGEDIDPDSPTGKHHLDGVSASCAILIDAIAGGYLTDDRPAPGAGLGALPRVDRQQRHRRRAVKQLSRRARRPS